MRQRKSWLCLFIAAVLCLSMAAPVFAAENTITFELKNTSGEVVKTVTAYQGDATTYGPDEDAQVRSTYYDGGVAYDLDAGQEVSGTLSGNMTFTYTQYTQTSKRAGSKNASGESDSDAQPSYDVAVRYVDESGDVITTRTITMNGRDHEFYAPAVFSRTVSGKTTFYTVKGSNKVTFKWNDKTTLTQDIVYQKTDSAQAGVTWTIYYMDAETGDTLGSVAQTVASGETATKTLNKTMQFSGKTYHLNAIYKSGEVSYTYGKGGAPISYVYYDPDGYDTSEKTRSIAIEYRNIADGSVVKTDSVKVSSYASGDTEVDLDNNFEQDGKTWVLAKGQKTPLAVSYFSPKDTYQVYVRDVNDTANENTIVVYEDVIENGGTITNTVTNRVVTGTTTVVAWNTVTGATRTLGTFGVNGQQLTNGQNAPVYANNNNANNTNDSTGQNGTADVSEDGVTLSRDAAPQASASDQSGLSTTAGIAIAAGACALALLLLLLFLSRRKKSEEDA